MAEQTQRIPLEGATRVVIDTSASSLRQLSVRWREDVDEISVSGQELSVDRAGDEIVLQAERRGRGFRGGGLFDLLPNITTPGVQIDWGGHGSSIEVSDEEGVRIRTGLGRGEGGSDGSSISVDLPVSVSATSIEVERGDLEMISPAGTVESKVKTGSIRSSGGDAELTVSLDAGDARIHDLDGTLHVMEGAGDIEISDCRTVTNVKLGLGDVSLAGLHGEAISLKVGSGDVAVRNCHSRAFSCKAGSGDVEITGGELDRIDLRSGSGDVECSALFGPHNQSFTTGSGSVSLGVPRGLPARFEVSTQGGEIASDIQLVSVGQRGPRSRRTRRQVGSVGYGNPRAEVSVRTSSGDVSLYWLRATSNAATTDTSIPMPSPSTSTFETGDAAVKERESPPHQADSPDEREVILQSLARGEISVDEADELLRLVEFERR